MVQGVVATQYKNVSNKMNFYAAFSQCRIAHTHTHTHTEAVTSAKNMCMLPLVGNP